MLLLPKVRLGSWWTDGSWNREWINSLSDIFAYKTLVVITKLDCDRFFLTATSLINAGLFISDKGIPWRSYLGIFPSILRSIPI